MTLLNKLYPLALMGAALLVGCSSTPTDEDPEGVGNKHWKLDAPPNKTLELDDFEHEWTDLDRDPQGRKDSYQVALWATERHNMAMRCLRSEPPARIQAARILNEVLERVPESSKDRYQLAVLRFREAAYWYRAADAVAWHMDMIRTYRRTAPPDKKGRELSEKEVEEALERGRPVLKEANERLKLRASESLKHFERYQQMRPDDKRILDVVWKLHFYLQNYDLALRWLDHLMAEFDRQGVPRTEPQLKDYEYIKERLQTYLANLRIQGTGKEGTPLPWTDKKLRGRIGSN